MAGFSGMGGGVAVRGAGALAVTVLTETGAVFAGAMGGSGFVVPSVCLRIAARTSPGLDILERSIFGLISFEATFVDFEDAPSPPDLSAFRTFSASCSSRELECVFFSVTPTLARTSSISLLLTSSSRAKSLILTLLIPLYFRGHNRSRSMPQQYFCPLLAFQFGRLFRDRFASTFFTMYMDFSRISWRCVIYARHYRRLENLPRTLRFREFIAAFRYGVL